jgi:hypothetical protein
VWSDAAWDNGVSHVDLEIASFVAFDLGKRVWGMDSLSAPSLKVCVVLVFEVGSRPVWPSARGP